MNSCSNFICSYICMNSILLLTLLNLECNFYLSNTAEIFKKMCFSEACPLFLGRLLCKILGTIAASFCCRVSYVIFNIWFRNCSGRQCCGSKYIEFGSRSGSRILAQFGSGSRVILSILKEKIQNNFREK